MPLLKQLRTLLGFSKLLALACSKFIDFILDNIECLEFLIVNKEIDKDKLYSYICLIDDIM